MAQEEKTKNDETDFEFTIENSNEEPTDEEEEQDLC